MILVQRRTLFRLSLWFVIMLVALAPGWPHAQSTVHAQDYVPIFAIQGDGLASPYAKSRVNTYGIVTAVAPDGFFMQDPRGDGRAETSDGIFVYTVKSPVWQPGSCVDVRNAYVDEYYQKTELTRAKVAARTAPCAVIEDVPAPLPAPRFGQDARTVYERYEGMLVTLDDWAGRVQGPTKRYANGDVEIAFVPAALAPFLTDGRVFHTEAREQAALVFLSGRLGALLPDANWGDTVAIGAQEDTQRSAVAIIDYSYGKYQVMALPGTPVARTVTPLPEDVGAPANDDDFTVCTFNALGLGQGTAQQPDEASYRVHLQRAASVIAHALGGCTILGLQETGTPADAEALAALLRQSNALEYDVFAFAGPQTSSTEFPLTNSLLVRRDRVQVVAAQSRQGCSARDYDVTDVPGTCPAGQYPLFDRPPLQADLVITGTWGAPVALRVIDNHWKSKSGDERTNAPRRVAQARFVAAMAQEPLDTDPRAAIVVLGDLNDYYGSEPVEVLRSTTRPALVHLFDALPALDRYTYIFDGSSQVLDHVLVSANLVPAVAEVNPVHISADYAAPAMPDPVSMFHTSDHDPVLVRLRPGGGAWLGGNLNYPGIEIEAIEAGGQVTHTAMTDARGEFRLWNLTPGALHLHLRAPALVKLPMTSIDINVAQGENRLAAFPGTMYTGRQ